MDKRARRNSYGRALLLYRAQQRRWIRISLLVLLLCVIVWRKRAYNFMPSSWGFYRTTPDLSPKLAVLITFPNSGTSYTIILIQRVTKYATASNYVGEVSRFDSHENVTVYKDHPEGPFWRGEHPPGIKTTLPQLPKTTVLVKSHCSAYDLNNGAGAYRLTSERFAGGCRFTHTTSNASQHGRYPAELVYKLVHLIRNPYDNLISRFHHEYNRRVPAVRNGNEHAINWTLQHPKNETGFHAFCHDIDSDFVSQYKEVGFSEELYEQVQRTMCHDEVISYVQWHNHAFDTSEILGVPTLVFHYEDYEKSFDSTLSNLLHFLELPRRAEPLVFHSGHGYNRGYFPPESRENLKKLAKQLASKRTWDAIARYFD